METIEFNTTLEYLLKIEKLIIEHELNAPLSYIIMSKSIIDKVRKQLEEMLPEKYKFKLTEQEPFTFRGVTILSSEELFSQQIITVK